MCVCVCDELSSDKLISNISIGLVDLYLSDDYTRVVLRGDPDPGSNDYINASYVTVSHETRHVYRLIITHIGGGLVVKTLNSRTTGGRFGQ